MVRVVRLERTVSWSQTRRDTNFAIPGYLISAIISRWWRKSKIFLSVVIPVVKAAFVPFSATGKNLLSPVSQGFAAFRPAPSRIPPRRSQTRRDTNFATPGYSISAIIPRWGRKSKIFLSVVIYVVKAAYMPFSATGGKPAIARAARHSGLLSKPRMDRVYALPNQARYQLRYTRILNDFMGMDPPEATRRCALHTIPVHYNTPAAKREAYSYPFFFDGKTLA